MPLTVMRYIHDRIYVVKTTCASASCLCGGYRLAFDAVTHVRARSWATENDTPRLIAAAKYNTDLQE